jgi:hypothetical protein
VPQSLDVAVVYFLPSDLHRWFQCQTSAKELAASPCMRDVSTPRRAGRVTAFPSRIARPTATRWYFPESPSKGIRR